MSMDKYSSTIISNKGKIVFSVFLPPCVAAAKLEPSAFFEDTR